MANFTYTRALREFALGDVHLDTDDIRLIPVMTNTTADTEEDKATISAFTTLDEFDGGARPLAFASRDALADEAVNEDTANDRAEFDATNFVFSTLANDGSRDIQGIVVYQHKTSDADSVPLFWIDTGGFPFMANGGDLTMNWNAQGIAQFTTA